MKIKSFFLLILILICIFKIQSCNTDQCPPCKGIKIIDTEARQWFMFGIGSKWIYRLAEDTSVYDTLTCSFIDSSRGNVSNCNLDYAPAMPCSQVLQLNFEHSNRKYFTAPIDTIKKSYFSILAFLPHESETILDFQSNCKQAIAGGEILNIPLSEVDKLDEFAIKDTSLTITLNGIKFTSVIYTERKYTQTNAITKIWYKKNIGILKYYVEQNRTWLLMHSEIKR